jgi:hypothetical protein
VTKKETLTNLDGWVDYAYQFGPQAAFIFLGNKNDLGNKQFGYNELKAYADRFKSPCFMTSAKTGENVEQAFQYMAHSIYRKEFAPSKEEVELQKQQFEVKPAVGAEDEIIDVFGREAGGFDIAMPVVREQFQKAQVSFENPSKADLEKVIHLLVNYLSFVKGQEAARSLERKLKQIMHARGLD